MTDLVTNLQNLYQWSKDVSDPRTENWLLLSSPWPIVVIFILYLLVVKYGPVLMKKRKPFSLKPIIIPYNFLLVLLSFYMFYEFLMSSWLANYSLRCQPVDYSTDQLALRTIPMMFHMAILRLIHNKMASVCWWFFFSKVIELLDTVFFILRKKPEQVTFLHVYHHCSMIINWYLGAKYVAGGQSFFVAMLNSGVHVLMYTYYCLAAFGPHMQKYLTWKRYLTQMQLMQFFAFIIHTGYNIIFEADCPFPRGYSIAVFIYALSLIALFSNFYYRSYTAKKRQKLL